MSATREHRNAAKLEQQAAKITEAVEEFSNLYHIELGAGFNLPDDFPNLYEEIHEVELAAEKLAKECET
jgi:hypothetical protein